MVSRVLQVAAQLGVFGCLASAALSTTVLAERCQASEHGMQALMTALHALELVDIADGQWVLKVEVREQLADEDVLAGLVGGYQDWLALDQAIQSGQAVAEPAYHKGAASLRQFLVSMHFSSLPMAQALAAQLPEPGPRQLLDLGGGIGTYAVAICQRFQGAVATVLELPQVAAIGRQLVGRSSVARRVRFIEGDYLADPFPPDNDLILMCNILHQETPRAVRLLFRKAATALSTEGRLLIHETLLDDETTRVELAVALAALNSLLYYGGQNYREYQIRKWLESAGMEVKDVQRTTQPGVRIITARLAHR
mgnify:FL=1